MRSPILIAVAWSLGRSVVAALVSVSDGESIQSAIDDAVDGDRIQVAAGTFPENLDFRGKRITVAGAGPETVIVGDGPVVRFTSGEGRHSVLDSVQLTGGATDQGGAILVRNASPTIQRCVLFGNRAQDNGAGIFVTGRSSRPLIRNNMLAFNTDPRPQATGDAHQIYVNGGSSAVIVNNTLVRGNGNAILLNSGKRRTIVVNNILAWNGSRLPNGAPTGRGICDFSGAARIRNNLFHRNRRSAVLTGGLGDFEKVTAAEQAVGESRFRDNLDGNPQFRRAPRSRLQFTADDLALKSSSPAKNAGNAGRRFRDRNGSRSDLGHSGGPLGWE